MTEPGMLRITLLSVGSEMGYNALEWIYGGGVMDNMTAKVSCFARAYHHKNNNTHIFDDTVAERILGEEYDRIAKNMTEGVSFFFPGFDGTGEEGLRLIVDQQLSPSVLARSVFCEEKLAVEKERGCTQYVIFASGYDTYAIRNTDSALSIYELDLPKMIADKAKRLERAGIRSGAVCIPCDLARAEWKEKLPESGYCVTRRAFGSLLGISYYLSKEEFGKLLLNINEIMAEGSVLCFDYPSVEESSETKKNQVLASGAGEQMKALYSYEELSLLLQKCGYELSVHMDDREMTTQYFSTYNHHNPTHRMQAPGGVAYVLATKKGSEYVG